MRAEPLPVLKLLFQNAEAPRSVLHGLTNCAALLRATSQHAPSPEATLRPLAAVEAFCDRLRRIDWTTHFEQVPQEAEDFAPAPLAAVEEGQSATRFAKERGTDGAVAESPSERDATPPNVHGKALAALLNDLLRGTLNLHNVIADVFLNHQAHLSAPAQPYLRGFAHGV